MESNSFGKDDVTYKRVCDNLLFISAWLTQCESKKGDSMQPCWQICELLLDASIDVEETTDAVRLSQARLTLPADQLKTVEGALEASNESVIYCKVSFDSGWANGKVVDIREGAPEMCILCVCEGESRRLYGRACRGIAEHVLSEDASADRSNADWQTILQARSPVCAEVHARPVDRKPIFYSKDFTILK